MAIVVFIVSVFVSTGLPRIIGMTMMGTGMSLELIKGAGFEGLSEGVLFILSLICLVTLAPLFSRPLKLGGYF